MLVWENETFTRESFVSEAEIEAVVQRYADRLFGPHIIYLPKAKVSTVGGRGSIPDGFVLDIQAEEWFIVEAERSVHGTWEHIAPQVSRQLAAVESEGTGRLVAQLALDAYRRDRRLRGMFRDLGIAELDIAGKLNAIVAKPPTIAIPIDSIPHDLKEWTRTLRNTVKIWVIQKYVSADDPTRVLYRLPEDESPTVTMRSVNGRNVTTVRPNGALPLQDLILGGVLKEGDTLTLKYRREEFVGVVRKDSIEVDGRRLSPSAAAGYCMQKAGNKTPNVNGWRVWKTRDGELLSTLRDRLQSSDNAKELSAADAADDL